MTSDFAMFRMVFLSQGLNYLLMFSIGTSKILVLGLKFKFIYM